ncbi:MAG: DUF4153 domain-containing protein [Bacteroidetes bacterium]|nr:DUF4153 domain-containing protein [Bacteroidota bacterium]
MARLPSVEHLIRGAFGTFLRFPLAILASLVAVSSTIYLVHINPSYGAETQMAYLWKIAICGSLGVFLFIAVTLYSESNDHTLTAKYGLQSLVTALIVVYYFYLSPTDKENIVELARYALFVIAAHLLVAFSAFIGKTQLNGFWQFNKSLFIQFLTAAIYTTVLWAGLSLALLAIDKLFKVEIGWRYYMYLWISLSGLFNTWFFLSGVPANIQHLEQVTAYPKGLKIFTQYVLLPLVTIYMVILYAYSVKIVIDMQLPRGWVSYLVVGCSVAGILSLLLIHPIRNDEGNTWIKGFSRGFYLALYPLIVLFILAIYKRVSQYGITENRYFLILLAGWLTVMSTYFLISKTKNIKIVPVSLCIIALLSSFGPWSAFSVGEHSQVTRLEKLLVKNGVLVDEKIKKANDTIPDQEALQITNIIHYLDKGHGYKLLQPWFSISIDSLFAADTNKYAYKPAKIMGLMGIEEQFGYDSYRDEDDSTSSVSRPFSFSTDYYNKSINVSGYNYYATFNGNYYQDLNESTNTVIINTDSLFILFSNIDSMARIKLNKTELFTFNLLRMVATLKADSKKQNYNNGNGNYTVSDSLMTYNLHNDTIGIKLLFTYIGGETKNKVSTITSFSANILIKKNNHVGSTKN